MSRPQRRIFGPLFYSTLILAVLVGGYSVVSSLGPKITEWQEVRLLVQQLRAADARSREQAAVRLGRRGPEVSVPLLVEAARDARSETRILAGRFLVQVGADSSVVVPVLAAAAGDDQEDVRDAAARGLGRVAAYDSLVIRSSAASPGGLAPALRAESLQVLLRLLKDRSSAVKTAAADALAEFGPVSAATADLISATDDEDRTVRFAAARTLLKVNGPTDPHATRTLVALVADPDAVADRPAIFDVLMGTNAEVQDQAVAALAALLSPGDPAVLPDVIACIEAAGRQAQAALPALEGLWNGTDPDVRASAGLAIASIEGQKSPRSVAILVRMIADPTLAQGGRESAIPWLRGWNSAALARATPDLIRQLGDGDEVVRQHALSLLSMIIDVTRAEMPGPTNGD